MDPYNFIGHSDVSAQLRCLYGAVLNVKNPTTGKFCFPDHTKISDAHYRTSMLLDGETTMKSRLDSGNKSVLPWEKMVGQNDAFFPAAIRISLLKVKKGKVAGEYVGGDYREVGFAYDQLFDDAAAAQVEHVAVGNVYNAWYRFKVGEKTMVGEMPTEHHAYGHNFMENAADNQSMDLPSTEVARYEGFRPLLPKLGFGGSTETELELMFQKNANTEGINPDADYDNFVVFDFLGIKVKGGDDCMPSDCFTCLSNINRGGADMMVMGTSAQIKDMMEATTVVAGRRIR